MSRPVQGHMSRGGRMESSQVSNNGLETGECINENGSVVSTQPFGTVIVEVEMAGIHKGKRMPVLWWMEGRKQ